MIKSDITKYGLDWSKKGELFKSHVCNISAFTLSLTTSIEKDRGLCIFIIIFLLLKFYLPCDDRVTYVNQKQETKIKPVEERWMQIARVTRVKNKILIWAIKKSLLLQIVTSFKRVSMGRAFTVTVWNLGHFTAKAEFLSVAIKRKIFKVNFLRLLVEICRFLRLTAKVFCHFTFNPIYPT